MGRIRYGRLWLPATPSPRRRARPTLSPWAPAAAGSTSRGWYVRGVTLPDDELVAALRAGDEAAFAAVVREWHAGLLRVARIFTPTRAVAEEVVQETWLRVLGALDRFEGRSSLKTWVFRILVNTAKTRAQREGRVVPFSSLHDPGRVPEAAVDAERFRPEDDERYPGHWSSPPRSTRCLRTRQP